MHSLYKTICILFLSVCLMVQGVALAFSPPDMLASGQASMADTTASSDPELAQPDAPLHCCDHLALHDEEADKDKSVEWKLDVHDGSSNPLSPLADSLLKFPRADDDNYASPSYPFHRPPNSLS